MRTSTPPCRANRWPTRELSRPARWHQQAKAWLSPLTPARYFPCRTRHGIAGTAPRCTALDRRPGGLDRDVCRPVPRLNSPANCCYVDVSLCLHPKAIADYLVLLVPEAETATPIFQPCLPLRGFGQSDTYQYGAACANHRSADAH